ncbi:Rap1 GTPase-GDP dissociation stimulator 1-B-like protein [Emericellopsis cladophorae]|uniref:Rap1 GTPase-GDP dissociation stimulator 1-B-like protein n=1 Tax=Emericellopsis cladophorae TaxID=2686198 RepID=A0A9Q0BG14_9HYPO|nr:Rap1 GTPase-GDP dissociation stimulator 1-B-like protein [Emericellopsis cladophorae]KAI6784547.1 Rap1 GTPase-GDP dissociation stimulator 1-B-like protein [Emericellopsis cladophorae]
MMLSAAEIEDLLANNGSGLTPDEYDEQPETEDVMKNRATLLTPVLETCRQLWDAKSDDLKLVAQRLGDGSRDVAWRIAFGESGILNFFLEINAAKSLSPDLQLHTLRLVGNSCADTDQNRARVVGANLFKPIMDLLEDESLTPVVVPVLYNIVVDYAQLHASQANLSAALIGRLAGPSIDEFAQLVTYMCKTLVLIGGQDGEATRADPSTVRVLLGLATHEPFSSDIEDFAILTSAAAAYLSMEEFQVRLISDGQLPLLLRATKHANTVFSDVQDEEGEDLTALLKAMRSTFQQTLADVTAQDIFLKQHPLNDPVSSELFSWLNGANRPLRSAACLSLGNLCRSDATSKAMVQEHKAHEPLIRLIADPDARDAQELHAALSFLKNMAIPIDNKSVLVDVLEPACVPRVLALDSMPQVQFAAVSLIRLLLINSPNNAEAICSRWRNAGQTDESQPDTVQKLAELFKRSDTEPVKMEIARGILGLCRVVQSQPVQSVLKDIAEANNVHDDEELRERFWKRYDFTEPLVYLVAQTKWPSVRSEAWFVFALICRSQGGGRALSKALEDEKAFSSLTEAVTGEQCVVTDVSEEAPTDAGLVPGGTSLQLEPQQIDPARQSDMARVDRENAVVMCQELLKHQPEDWPRRGALQALASQGTRKIVEGKSS